MSHYKTPDGQEFKKIFCKVTIRHLFCKVPIKFAPVDDMSWESECSVDAPVRIQDARTDSGWKDAGSTKREKRGNDTAVLN